MIDRTIPATRRAVIAIVLVLALQDGLLAQSFSSGPVFFDSRTLRSARAAIDDTSAALHAAVMRLRDDADAALRSGPHTVVEKTLLPESGDPHDYFSLGPYWWPDPARPDGRPYIRRDGEVNPETRGPATDRTRLGMLVNDVETLALAAALFSERRYAERALILLRTWFLDSETRMNPHLRYGQAIPGRVTGRGIGIIDTTALTRLLDAVGLLRELELLPDADLEGLRGWFDAYLDWMVSSTHGKDEAEHHNNHGSWYDTQMATYALFVGRRDLALAVLYRTGPARIEPHVSADGSQPWELDRTRGISYSLYNLAALFYAATLAEHLGHDLWHFEGEDGAGLRTAIDYLLPYLRDPSAFPYQQITPVGPERPYELLVRAARAYDEPTYTELALELIQENPSARVRLMY